MAYQSGEININNSWTENPAVAIFMDYIVVFAPQGGVGGNVNTTYFPLSELVQTNAGTTSEDEPAGYQEPINAANVIDSSKWTTVATALPWLGETSRLSLVACPQNMFFFLNSDYVTPDGDPLNAIHAFEYTVPDGGVDPTKGNWGSQITLLDVDGNILNAPADATVCARLFDNTTSILVTCSAVFPGGGTQNPQIFIGLYDTNDLNRHTNQWKARHMVYESAAGIFDDAQYIAADWYFTAGAATPEFNLLTLVQSGDVSKNCLSLITEIRVADDGEVSLGDTLVRDFQSDVFFTDIRRDPGGRLRIWTKTPESTHQSFVPLLTLTTLPQLANAESPINLNGTTESIMISDGRYVPCCVFYTFLKGKYTSTVENLPADNYPVYEFVFYGGYLKCQALRAGTIQVIPGAKVIDLPPEDQQIFILGGIINGPIPIPLENYVNYNPSGGDDNDGGGLLYGVEDKSINAKSISNAWSVGFQSTGEVTKGIGAAWDISLKGGMGQVSTVSNESSVGTSLLQPTTIDSSDKAKPTINQTGKLLEIGVETSVTAFSYLDEYTVYNVDSTNSAEGGGAKTATVLATVTAGGISSFTPFDVTPGDLTTYTPAAINARMSQLYANSTINKDFGYAGDNYFGDIICQNALPFDAQTPYLKYSWSEGGAFGQKFNQIKTSYQENSWTLDASVYAGVSGGGGVDVFGLGEEFTAKFLAGVNYSHLSSESVNQSLKWGIGIDKENWGPPKRDDLPDAVGQYDFRVYFLPVPAAPSTLSKNYWTEELLKYMADSVDITRAEIDPNGACWRIVYVVTSITYRNGKTILYDGSLDRPSVYKIQPSESKAE